MLSQHLISSEPHKNPREEGIIFLTEEELVLREVTHLAGGSFKPMSPGPKLIVIP